MRRYIVDTHILLWAFSDPSKISRQIRSILEDTANEIYFSPINLWEISIKYRIGKLNLGGFTPEEFYQELKESFFICLPLENDTLINSYRLSSEHKDPFDRALFWQAIQSEIVLLSADSKSDSYITDGLQVIH